MGRVRNSLARRLNAKVEALDGRQLLSGGFVAGAAASAAPPDTGLPFTPLSAPLQVTVAQPELIRMTQGTTKDGTLDSTQSPIDQPWLRRLTEHPLRSRSLPRTIRHFREARPARPVHRVGSLVVTAPPGPLPPKDLGYIALASAQNSAVVAQAIVELTNYVRAQNGANPLTVSPALMEAAAAHSQDMARLGRMAHDIPGIPLASLTDRAAFVGYRYRLLGENIAFNQADAASVVASWMNSPPHRENMLNPAFTDLGVGIAWDSRGEPYYTMMLGKPA